MLLLPPPSIARKGTDAFFRIGPEFQPASQFETPSERIFGAGEPAVAGGVEFGAQGALEGEEGFGVGGWGDGGDLAGVGEVEDQFREGVGDGVVVGAVGGVEGVVCCADLGEG